MQPIGKYLLISGLLIAALGLLLGFAGNKLHWFGRLPGDIRVERGNFRLYMPLATSILLSVVLSLVLWLIGRFFR